MKYKLTINDLLCGRWFLSLIALLLMSVEMQAEETSTTYTFSGMSAVSGADYQYEVTSTSGGASETWKIKNFSATDESYHNRTTSVYVFDTQSVGISNIFATSESATIIKFQLVSDFVLHGDFVSAEITYSTSGMSYSNAVVCKVGNSSYSMLTDTSEQLGTSPATISLKSLYEDEKYFNDQKVALDFTFITNKFDGYDGEFSIQSVKITTTPATDYNLWVGGVQVNSGNASNILNDDNNPTAVFDVSTNTLTLNNATINGNVVSGLADDLTVHLVGTNTINTQGTKAFVSTLQSEPSLTFTAANGGLLKTNIPRTQGDAVISSGFSDNIPEDYRMSWDADGFCSLGQYYGLYLYTFVNDNSYFQPYYVTAANCDRLMGKYNESNNSWDNTVITISYDDSEKTLTLNNASPESANPSTSTFLINCDGANAKNITIMLLGENTLRQNPDEWGAGFIRNNVYEGTVTITTDLEKPGTLTMPDIEEYTEESGVISAYNVIYKNGLGYSKDENNVRYIKTLPGYGLTVAGIPVNSSNAGNVLGDDLSEEGSVASVSFDATTNTLTLNEVWIDASNNEAIVSDLANLTIFLVGENGINGSNGFTFNKSSSVEKATITFTTDEESNGSLYIYNLEERLFGAGVTPAYTDVSIKHDGDSHTIDSQLGVRVGGVDVTLFNKDNVLGDGKVSYNAETYTLTLNNATIEPEEETSGIDFSHDENFTIALIGNNSVRGGEGCTAISHSFGVETPYVYFVKGDAAQHFSLTLIAQSENELIDGFYANYGDFFVFDEEDDGTYTSTISTTAFGGTGSADEPFLIKTADDLKKFAYHYNKGRFSNNVHIQLFNDIDCENEEGFTTIADNTDATFYGVFDGNHKTISNLTMTGVGLFGNVSKDDDFGVGTIKDLTLSYFNLTGKSDCDATGGIVASQSDGAIVSNCSVENSIITCASNNSNPEVGGIVGRLNNSTVTGCTVNNVQVKAETTNTESGNSSNAGGIVGYISQGTVSGCVVKDVAIRSSHVANSSTQFAGGIVGSCDMWAEDDITISNNSVKGTTTVSAEGNIPEGESGTPFVGAIVGQVGTTTTLSNNTYEYSVNVSIKPSDAVASTVSGYTQRGSGSIIKYEGTDGYPELYAELNDVFDDNGAVMYTKSVTLPVESAQATVMGVEGTYYSTDVVSDAIVLNVAPGQTATLNVMPGEGLAIASFIATNNTTDETISTSSEYLGDNETQYTFTMPDAPVTVAVTTAAVYGLSIAGVTVTEQNAANIFGDGTVSYNAGTHTLTLNGATIGNDGSDPEPMEVCGIDYSETADLTISLKGTNTIYGMGGCEAIRYNGQGDVAPKLIFTKGDDQGCSLQLNTSSDYERTAISGGFSEIQGVWGVGATDNGLAIIADNEVKYDSEDGLTIEKVINYTVNYIPLSSTMIASYYGLAISGVPVYEGNKSNITGEGIYGNGTASFDPSTNTLTLNNVNLNPDYAQNDGDLRVSIVTSLAQLNINLIGESQTYAIKATSEDCVLTFQSAEANRGTARLNFWYNAEPYFIGFGENKVTYDDGLCMREDSYNSSFPMIVALYVPQIVTEENERGLYFPDHVFTFALEEEIEGFDIYYANMLGGDPVKTTDGTFSLGTGRYVLNVYPIYPGMDTDPGRNWQYSSEIYAKVIEKPTFSVDTTSVYNNDITVFLQNIPEQGTTSVWDDNLQENIEMPQVWYYIDDNKTDSVRYDATKGIPVTESCKVSAYILDEDSGRVVKSAPVEAEYTIVDRTELNISYADNTRRWASYCASENDLETPEGLQAYVVTEATTSGVTIAEISYIPQGVGVLLRRTTEITEPIRAKILTEDPEQEVTTNLLKGTTESKAVSEEEGNVYVLYNDGFTRATKGTIPAHRAYLVLAAETEAEGRLSIFEDETTALKLVNSEERIVNSEVYDLQGRKVNHSSLFTSGKATLKKGLYILNGKKQVIK